MKKLLVGLVIGLVLGVTVGANAASSDADIGKSGSGYYFKAGSYCQSNPSKGDPAGTFCEVEIYSLGITHA